MFFCNIRNLNASEQQLVVMNAIMRRLRQQDSEAKLAFLAYHSCMEVPEQVKPEEGIFLEYAPINRTFDRPIQEQDCEDTKNLPLLLAYFGKENAKVLEYWYDNSLFSDWKKPPKAFTPNGDVIRMDMGYYRSLGCDYLSSFACFLGEDYEELFGEPDISDF